MIDKLESIVYQTGVSKWKVILFDVSDKNSRKLIAEEEFPNRYEADDFALRSEDKLVYGIYPSDYNI